jgi:hypothetical protein
MRKPRRIAAAGSGIVSMTASPIVFTSVPPLAGSSARTERQKVRDEGGGIVVTVRLGGHAPRVLNGCGDRGQARMCALSGSLTDLGEVP